MYRVAYQTLGCKVNQYETEKIRESLESAGFKTISFNSPADAYIINTCSVTQVADSKSRAAVRKALRTNPDAFVIVSGCYSELEPGEIAQIEGVDLVVPNSEKETIPERLIARFGMENNTNNQSAIHTSARPRVRTRAVVKVQDGCDQFCAYCIIPYARPGKTSRPLESVISELKALAEFGYKEIVLTGIRLGSYSYEDCRLPGLIRAAAEVEGIKRIRLSSIEPWEVDDNLLEAMQNPKVCRHLHIPLQSGGDRILKAMGRPYDTGHYLEIIRHVRERIDGIGITTDVIVGFPGEDDNSFENTMRTIESAGFSRLHVFRYSQRKHTRAADMPDQVDADIKKLRAEKLMELGKLSVRRFASSLVGKTVEVLVENEAKSGKLLTGYADNYAEVVFPGSLSLKGSIVKVQINEVGQEGRASGIAI